MDKIREEFEVWFCSTIPYPIAKESWFAIMDDGDYIITDVQAAWAGWKASRAALNAELDVIDARIKHECEKADYLKAACAKIIDDINSIQIERF